MLADKFNINLIDFHSPNPIGLIARALQSGSSQPCLLKNQVNCLLSCFAKYLWSYCQDRARWECLLERRAVYSAHRRVTGK